MENKKTPEPDYKFNYSKLIDGKLIVPVIGVRGGFFRIAPIIKEIQTEYERYVAYYGFFMPLHYQN